MRIQKLDPGTYAVIVEHCISEKSRKRLYDYLYSTLNCNDYKFLVLDESVRVKEFSRDPVQLSLDFDSIT